MTQPTTGRKAAGDAEKVDRKLGSKHKYAYENKDCMMFLGCPSHQSLGPFRNNHNPKKNMQRGCSCEGRI